MLPCVRACADRRLLGAARLVLTAFATEALPDPHVMTTEQEQGHLLEKLTDLEETELRARLLAAHRLHDPHKPRFATQDTMADTILAQSLEAAKEDFEARMEAKGKKVLCEHGHEHDFCCGGDKSDVQAGE